MDTPDNSTIRTVKIPPKYHKIRKSDMSPFEGTESNTTTPKKPLL